MKKGFPHKFLWIPIGWKDLGRINSFYNWDKEVYAYRIHEFCNSRLKVGEEDSRFLFCPKCLVKIEEATK